MSDLPLKEAAEGDLESQRIVTLYFTRQADASLRGLPTEGDPYVLHLTAEVYGRMTASRGHAQDEITLALILFNVADFYRRHGKGEVSLGYETESLTILGRLAAEGVPDAAGMLAAYTEALSPAAAEKAAESSRPSTAAVH